MDSLLKKLEELSSLIKKFVPKSVQPVQTPELPKIKTISPPPMTAPAARAKKDAVQRQCQVCNNWVGSTHMAVDHIEPVISIEDGFQDWNEFIDRVWCAKSNLQRICDPCHDKKTYAERIARLTKQYTEEL